MKRKDPHLSYSQLRCYCDCSLKYRFAYVDRVEPEFTPAALNFGAAVHCGIQAYLQSVLEADPLRPDQLVDVYRQEWRSQTTLPIRYSHRESEESLLKTAKNLFSLFVEEHDPSVEVVAVEEEFTLNLRDWVDDYPSDLPPYVGTVDAILKNDGGTALVDYKTAARKPNGDANGMQLVGYSLGSRVMGYDPDDLQYRYEYLLKTTKPELIRHLVSIDENDRRRFLKTITRVWTAIQTSIFYPNPSYICGSCGYQSLCKEW